MRIVAGALKGRRIETPAGGDTRPTSDRARQAVFNILEHAPWSPGLEDLRVIDLFAGSGAMGLEALSRGAAFCLFVETAAAAGAAIQGNIRAFGLETRTRVMRRDARTLGARPPAEPPYHLAFLDPPYRQGMGEAALGGLLSGGWLAPSALAVLEVGADEEPVPPDGFERLDERRYGAAKVVLLRTG